MESVKSKDVFLSVCVIVLLAISLSWHDSVTAPPMAQRIVFVLFAIIPTFFLNYKAIPAVITCLSTLSFYGAYHGYFPAELTYIVPIVFVLVLIRKKYHVGNKKSQIYLLSLAFYTLLVDLINQGQFNPSSLAFLMAFLFFFLTEDDIAISKMMGFAFCISSIVLSYQFLFAGEEFVRNYSNLGLERTFIRDPNYFGAIVGFGAAIATKELFHLKSLKLGEIILYSLCVIISVITIVMNASRGVVLSYAVFIFIILLFMPIKSWYKFLFVIIGFVGLSYMFESGMFELLEYRVGASMDTTGSGRTVIWKTKLDYYFNSDLSSMLFGCGYETAFNIDKMGFHNDYLAFLVGYGLVGLFLFILCLLSFLFNNTYKKINLRGRIESIGLFAYLLMVIFTLEPFFIGRYTFLLFCIYIYLDMSRKNDSMKVCNTIK